MLDVAELRRRLAQGSAPAFSIYADDGAGREAGAHTAASVLVPIVTHADGLTVVFTQRTVHLRSHSGQVSFPGGRAEPHDPTAEFTALREAQEEIGLPAERVEVLARLPDYFTRTGYRVTPVVGLIEPPLALVPDPREVDDVFEVPLEFLLDPVNHLRETRELPGGTVGFYVMQYGERRIWGATAGMLINFYRQLAGAGAAPGG
jgi:8-oxo-dGTP pyrophosphatase MutT (NUDIX family)